ncbi:Rho GTPase-activating protein 15 [Anas platyrhynchos]|uniref:Rho GTPase-activating protein 15 n=1 Tax=Anas platyrhynchos TaxID=8839 RepID=R0LYQ4_ANAPL|nr:Rho GTPase-activating protein 15 [Anas platyrhynchos]
MSAWDGGFGGTRQSTEGDGLNVGIHVGIPSPCGEAGQSQTPTHATGQSDGNTVGIHSKQGQKSPRPGFSPSKCISSEWLYYRRINFFQNLSCGANSSTSLESLGCSKITITTCRLQFCVKHFLPLSCTSAEIMNSVEKWRRLRAKSNSRNIYVVVTALKGAEKCLREEEHPVPLPKGPHKDFAPVSCISSAAEIELNTPEWQVNPVAMERSTTSDTASEKPSPSHSTGAVQMRIKNANSHHDRLSQSKSMILSENVKVAEPWLWRQDDVDFGVSLQSSARKIVFLDLPSMASNGSTAAVMSESVLMTFVAPRQEPGLFRHCSCETWTQQFENMSRPKQIKASHMTDSAEHAQRQDGCLRAANNSLGLPTSGTYTSTGVIKCRVACGVHASVLSQRKDFLQEKNDHFQYFAGCPSKPIIAWHLHTKGKDPANLYDFGRSPTPEKPTNEANDISWDSLKARINWTNFKKSLWTSKKKNSYSGSKVSLWQTVVGGLRSKPGAPVAAAVGKELLEHRELPLSLNGVFHRTTAWLQGTESWVNRHRRNHSQHNLTLADIISTQDHTVVEKEGYLLKAKIADGGKKLRKNWSTSWIVLTARKMEFYKESKQPALANLKPGYKPECVDLCGAQIEWTPEKSSRKNVFQDCLAQLGAAAKSQLTPGWLGPRTALNQVHMEKVVYDTEIIVGLFLMLKLNDNHEDKVNVPAVEPEEQLYTQLGVGDESLTVKLALPG